MANLLIALKNIVQSHNNDLVLQYRSLNRMNAMGEALEFYVKDMFSGAFAETTRPRKERRYSSSFSYLGNQNNPPDIIIKGSDAIEVKKLAGLNMNSLALNSSYPKDFLYSDSPLITTACRDCEEWSRKDLLYVIGNLVDNKIKSLWFVYGDCYAASREVYERIQNAISAGVNALPDIEFGETNELGRVNRVDPLGITDLRIRGMWGIKHPARVFDYLRIDSAVDFQVCALMLAEKYNAFPQEDRLALERLSSAGLTIRDVKIKSPNNPAKLVRAKLVQL